MKRSFFVYVIALDPAVARRKKFREANPRMGEDAECFYVGQSVHDPDCRYRQHKLCHGGYGSFRCICGAVRRPLTKKLSNYYARAFGRHLARTRYERYNPIKSRAAAERLEEELALSLRAVGHGVWYG